MQRLDGMGGNNRKHHDAADISGRRSAPLSSGRWLIVDSNNHCYSAP